MNILKIKNLKKNYGNIEAVKGISFDVREGELFAFLGCNGAGKSTTIDILCTFLKPDEGDVFINGYQLQKEDALIRQSIGIVFQDSLLDQQLTVEENLMTRGSLYGFKKQQLHQIVKKTMEEMNIEKYAKRKYGTLSGGQKRRCDIARVLIHQPKVLFLDEPTTGLDPQTRKEVWKTIYNLKKRNHMTVFLTTHYMEEAIDADNIVIIDEGRIVAQGTPQNLRQRYTKDKFKITPQKDVNLYEKILSYYPQCYTQGTEIIIPLNTTLEALDILNHYKKYILDFEVSKGSMDDVFLEITGKELYK